MNRAARRFLLGPVLLGAIDRPRDPLLFGRDPDGAPIETRVRVVAGKGKRRRGVRGGT